MPERLECEVLQKARYINALTLPLSTYLFTRYLRELIASLVQCATGCNVGGTYVNILAYADAIVLLAPSWTGLQHLINTFSQAAQSLEMQCSVNKTVCMSYAPTNRSKIVSHSFPDFTLDGMKSKFVSSFRYLGHIVQNNEYDDDDIASEIRNLFVRTNILKRMFHKCSLAVKLILFKCYCMCFYDIGLWSKYTAGALAKFKSCYCVLDELLFPHTYFRRPE